MTITPAVARAMAGVEEVKLESGVKVDDWDGLKVELTTVRQENGGDIALKKLEIEKYSWTKGKLKNKYHSQTFLLADKP